PDARAQVVLLDHGMYRRLDPDFRLTYSKLWKAFMTRDTALGERCAVDLGVEPGLYDALSLILTWRPTSTTARGMRLALRKALLERGGAVSTILRLRIVYSTSRADRVALDALVAKYKVILSHDSFNAFLERLPRDMLFVMRTSDLVRSLNKVREG
ncbi:unnamed protein product, partial [Ectocarpus sp. 8 AP-2014]